MKEKNKMANFYETVLTVLKSDERFVAEDRALSCVMRSTRQQ